MRPTKTQISWRVCTIRSECSLTIRRKSVSFAIQNAPGKHFVQTVRICRLIRIYSSSTCSTICLQTLRLKNNIVSNTERTKQNASVAQFDAPPTGDQEVAGSTPAESATFFHGDSLPSADSRRAVVSFWWKNLHNIGKPLRGLSLPSKSVVRSTGCARHDPIGLTGP